MKAGRAAKAAKAAKASRAADGSAAEAATSEASAASVAYRSERDARSASRASSGADGTRVGCAGGGRVDGPRRSRRMAVAEKRAFGELGSPSGELAAARVAEEAMEWRRRRREGVGKGKRALWNAAGGVG